MRGLTSPVKFGRHMTNAKLSSSLTDEERAAGGTYGANSDFFHACWQGRQDDVCHHQAYDAFAKIYKATTRNLDSAIGKSVLQVGTELYSGHGRWYSIFGSLTGSPDRFVGLMYRYPGFISTSQSRLIAVDKFLRVRAASGSRPALLRFQMTAGQCALDMH